MGTTFHVKWQHDFIATYQGVLFTKIVGNPAIRYR